MISRTANNLQFSSLFDNARNKISQVLGSQSFFWKLKPDLIISKNQIVIFTSKNNKIEIIDLGTMSAYNMVVPFQIDSLLLWSSDRWLIQNTLQEKFILQRSSSDNPCPNVLRKIDENEIGPHKLGSLLACSKTGCTKDMLSKAFNKEMDFPSRIVATSNTYASIIVGFPEFDNSNKIFSFPRSQRVNSFIDPIITQTGQIIRIVAPSHVPESALYKEKARDTFCGYLEITDPLEKKLHYIPIPA